MSAELVESLLRLGDDRLVLGHRLSEWCGHAPIVEEDIALANLALDCVGQASDFLGLAGELEGRGRDADALAFFRGPTEFRNALLVEQPNGDFACTIARQVFFDAAGAHVLAQLAARQAREAGRDRREGRQGGALPRAPRARLVAAAGHAEPRRATGGCRAAVDELWPFTVELVTPDDARRSRCARRGSARTSRPPSSTSSASSRSSSRPPGSSARPIRPTPRSAAAAARTASTSTTF